MANMKLPGWPQIFKWQCMFNHVKKMSTWKLLAVLTYLNKKPFDSLSNTMKGQSQTNGIKLCKVCQKYKVKVLAKLCKKSLFKYISKYTSMTSLYTLLPSVIDAIVDFFYIVFFFFLDIFTIFKKNLISVYFILLSLYTLIFCVVLFLHLY